MRHKFESAKDSALLAILWGTAITLYYLSFMSFSQGVSAFPIGALTFACGCLILWISVGTHYVVTETTLEARSGPFKFSIRVDDILEILPSNNLISSPAMSLDRLKLSHKKGVLYISPKDRAAFLKLISEINPGISISN
jgi:hypothetical protein